MMDETDDVTLNFGEEDEIDRRKKLKHPAAVFFHVAFRASAILAYLFCNWFSSSFISSFILIVIFLSMDFWTVKNITGRLLVGLRWWNYVDDDGKSHWVYESRKGSSKSKISEAESRIFWLSLVICQVLWVVFFFAALFRLDLKFLMVVIVGTMMNGANFYGYIRCKYGSKKKLTSVATGFLGRQLWQSMLSSKTDTEEQNKQ
ncbi:hypothetical protein KUTeg_003553 [Tegillarca granosa]|uniref:Golgi apparatus membrane protein TVP23 homolog n=1 Tax=Tegillarca granosa TaxID=220873 RepID=A0ABQ9FRA4_TEGGR|nr:hypothetical protein KUTeg_003553 [Tegillarca granosa]